MAQNPKYSVIIPVYNRPDEIRELLESLVLQEFQDFEVLVIEDGSTIGCESEVNQFNDQLNIRYFKKPNSGQGFSRNFGMERAGGDYFVIFDSDCIIPPNYFTEVNSVLQERKLDAWGGPDAAHSSFTDIQKAISYSMTSLFTTGGIRGRKKHAGTYHPRSFNMGISREVFQKVGGFAITRMGEDIEYSIRIIKAGFKIALVDQAIVFHKRRTNFAQFYKQLNFFGRARINIGRFYRKEIKLVHLFPALFTLGLAISLLAFFLLPGIGVLLLGAYAFYFLLIAIDASLQNKSIKIGLLSAWAALVQLSAYGVGFLTELTRGFKHPLSDRNK